MRIFWRVSADLKTELESHSSSVWCSWVWMPSRKAWIFLIVLHLYKQQKLWLTAESPLFLGDITARIHPQI